MKFKVKNMHIAAGTQLVVIVNQHDALKYDLHHMDRLKIIKGRKIETVVVNIAESNKTVPQGSIGIFEEVEDLLKLKNGDMVNVYLAGKPKSIEFIKKKLDGYKLKKPEIDQIVWDIVHNKLSSTELTYFVAASYTNIMSMNETIMLTKAMASQGISLKLNKYPVIDKHSIGGIPGNRTTMIVVPIIAAAGYVIPKTSSRSITSPAGTADTMEVLSEITFSLDKMKHILKKTNGCIIWGGSLNLAPADDKIINVERPLEIDAESQLLSSIMAKKLSVSSTHILIDIPTGNGSKVKNFNEASNLKNKFEILAKRLRKKVKVIITDGRQPIGNGIGPALEARDVLWILERDNRRALDLERKSLKLASEIFKMIGVKDSYKRAFEILDSGKAFNKMIEIIKAQKGKCFKSSEIKMAKFTFELKSKKQGRVKKIDNRLISRAARLAGAPYNKGSGIFLYKHLNDSVKKNESLLTLFSHNLEKLEYAKELLKKSAFFKIS